MRNCGFYLTWLEYYPTAFQLRRRITNAKRTPRIGLPSKRRRTQGDNCNDSRTSPSWRSFSVLVSVDEEEQETWMGLMSPIQFFDRIRVKALDDQPKPHHHFLHGQRQI